MSELLYDRELLSAENVRIAEAVEWWEETEGCFDHIRELPEYLSGYLCLEGDWWNHAKGWLLENDDFEGATELKKVLQGELKWNNDLCTDVRILLCEWADQYMGEVIKSLKRQISHAALDNE